MKKTKKHISSMQVELWKMKDRVYEETKNMDCKEFFSYIRSKSKKFNAVYRSTGASSSRASK